MPRAPRPLILLGSTAIALVAATPATAAITFAAPVTYAAGDEPRSAAVVDLNGDTHLDIAIANGDSDTVTVHLGNGTGVLAPAVAYAAGDRPRDIAAADLDGDGDTDLVVTANGASTVAVLRNNGDGTFAAPVATSLAPALLPFGLTIADLDADGVPDVAVALESPPAATNGISVLLGEGDGTFAAPVRLPVGSVSAVAAGDMDADGDLDLVGTAAGAGLSVLVTANAGDGSFGPATLFGGANGQRDIALADLDGDGDLDAVTASEQLSAAAIILGDGMGALGAPGVVPLTAAGSTFGVAIADLDGDGDPEVAAANRSTNTVSVLRGAGTGMYGATTTFAVGAGPRSVAVGDLNGDGRRDLVTADSEGDSISVLLNTAVNAAPTGDADSYDATEDADLVVPAGSGVLADDADTDFDTLSAVVESGPADGTLTLAGDGSFIYVPDPDFAGVDGFTYRVGDGRLQSDPVSVTITVAAVDDAPTAGADAFTTPEDTALTATAAEGVLAGDADTEGDTLTAALVSGPTNGTLALAPDGSFTYTPNAHYAGPDGFTYRAVANGQQSAETTVALTVTPVDDAPTAQPGAFTTAQDTPLVAAAPGVLAGAADVDGDPIVALPESPPANGTLVLAPNGSFIYTPAAGFAGADSFTYRAVAGPGASAPRTVAITVTPAPAPPAPPAPPDDRTPVTPPDTVPPGLRIQVPGAVRIGRTTRLTPRVICGEPCTVRVLARLGVRGGRPARFRLLPSARITLRLAPLTRTAAADTDVRIDLRRARAAALSALRAGRRVVVRLTVTATDAAGNSRRRVVFVPVRPR